MTRKANRPPKRRREPSSEELQHELGPKQPIHIFGCPDCELLLIEFPDIQAVNCPWCHHHIDVYVVYSFVAFAPGIRFSKGFDSKEKVILVE